MIEVSINTEIIIENRLYVGFAEKLRFEKITLKKLLAISY